MTLVSESRGAGKDWNWHLAGPHREGGGAKLEGPRGGGAFGPKLGPGKEQNEKRGGGQTQGAIEETVGR